MELKEELEPEEELKLEEELEPYPGYSQTRSWKN